MILSIISLLAIFILGYLIANLFIGNHYGEKIGLSFLLGSCLLSLLLFFLEKIGVSFTPINSWLVILTAIFLAFLTNLFFKKPIIPKVNQKIAKKSRLPLIFLVFISASSFISNLVTPIKDWDALTLFDLRAKAFLFTHNSSMISTDSYFTLHNFYTTMMHYWFWLTGWFSPMPFYSLAFASFLILSHFLFRRNLNSKLSILFTTALALSPHIFENTFIAYTNLSYSIFLVLGAIYMYYWSKKLKWSDLFLGLFFSIMTIWVRKVEPLWLANLAVIPYFLIFKQNNKTLKILVFAPLLLVIYYTKSHFSVITNFNLQLLLQVINFLKWSVFNYYFPFFIIPFFVFLYQVICRQINWEALILVLSHLILIILSSYGFASEMPGYWSGIPDTFRRLTLYWPLLVVFIVSLSFSSNNTSHNRLK